MASISKIGTHFARSEKGLFGGLSNSSGCLLGTRALYPERLYRTDLRQGRLQFLHHFRDHKRGIRPSGKRHCDRRDNSPSVCIQKIQSRPIMVSAFGWFFSWKRKLLKSGVKTWSQDGLLIQNYRF